MNKLNHTLKFGLRYGFNYAYSQNTGERGIMSKRTKTVSNICAVLIDL